MKIKLTLQKTYPTGIISKIRKYIPHFSSNAHDTFEHQNTTVSNVKMEVFNPHTRQICYQDANIDLTEVQFISLESNELDMLKGKHLMLYYNPKLKGVLKNKITNKPIEVAILRSDEEVSNCTTYHFLSKNLDKEYGYVIFKNFIKNENSTNNPFKNSCEDVLSNADLLQDFKEQNIIGSRIVVAYLQNFMPKKVGGVGKLADKIAVYHCMSLGIEPNIVSDAVMGTHILHFLRGKRFLPVMMKSSFDFFNSRFGTVDLNSIISNLIKKHKSHLKDFDISDWSTAQMYMPKSLARKYAKEIKKEGFPL